MKAYQFAIRLFAVGLLSGPLSVSANTLPAATGGEAVASLSQNGFGTLTFYQVPGGSATALPGFASANDGGAQAVVSADSYYYFEVTAPAGLVQSTATVDLFGTTATTSGGGEGQAEASVGSQPFSFACAGVCSPTGPVLIHSLTVELNNPVEIVLTALAESGAATALADPYITIDPSTPNAALLSVEVSDGVSNVPTSPVPLPASALLMLGGLGGLVFIGRRRTPAVAAV